VNAALDRLRRTWLTADWPLYVVVVLVTCAVTAVALELWNADLTVPFNYAGDALAVGSHFKTVHENGWYEFNPLLSAPFGQTYSDFPTAENLNFVWAKILGWFISDWAVSMNLYFLIGFPLAAATATWLLRLCGISRAMTIPLATLFAIAPYHFVRGEPHLFLASYYIVPLAVGLLIRVVRGERIWGWRQGGNRVTRWFGRGAGTVAIVGLTATIETYYAVFFVILLSFAGLVSLIRFRSWSRFFGAVMAGVLTVFGVFLNTLNDMIYSWVNGPNPLGFERGHADAEIYALKLTQLLLPFSGNRVPILARIRELYDSTYPLPSEEPALGAVGAFGLVALFLYVAYLVVSGGRVRFRSAVGRERADLFAAIAGLVFVAFLFSTIGGLSTLISFVTADLRGWNRMAIYISIFSLVAVGILLDAGIRWLVARRGWSGRGRSILAAGLVVALLGIGFVDQTPAGASASYASTATKFHRDQAWFDRVEAAAGRGATILQLPYEPFPELTGPTGILGSETLIPYLQTEGIAWTGGGITGRPRADWPGTLYAQYTPAQMADLAAAAGMTGIHVDRASMFPSQIAPFDAAMTAAAGTPLVSADGRYEYYSLARVKAKLESEFSASTLKAVGKRVVNPVTMNEQTTFTTSYTSHGVETWTAKKPSPLIAVDNDASRAVSATISLSIGFQPAAGWPSDITVTLPDGSRHVVSLTDGKGHGSWHIRVPVGLSTIAFTTSESNGTRVVPITVFQQSIVDDTTAHLLAK
jgi:phosphoglycerol transferase